jgi:hypothetical protein
MLGQVQRGSHTPDSVDPQAVPSSISAAKGHMAACGLPGVTRHRPCRCDEIPLISGGTLSPCSRLHARLADGIAAAAGGLLPHPFTPHRNEVIIPAGLLSVAVVVRRPLPHVRPHLLFHEATVRHNGLSQTGTEWESGSSSTGRRPVATVQTSPKSDLSMFTPHCTAAASYHTKREETCQTKQATDQQFQI